MSLFTLKKLSWLPHLTLWKKVKGPQDHTNFDRFENSWLYLAGLLLLALIGFWKSYFLKIFDPSIDFEGYFHFHAFMALSWIGVLIIQPFLIRKNNWKLHRRTGRAGHIIMVLFYLSVILLTHHQESSNPSPQYIGVFIPCLLYTSPSPRD